MTDDVKMYLFMKLSQVQPLTQSEMPVGYLKNPNLRIFYMLKTFSIRQVSYMWNK
jgi:hypothetical protein